MGARVRGAGVERGRRAGVRGWCSGWVAMWCGVCEDGGMTNPDFPLIHAALIARGIPSHVVSDGCGTWDAVVIGYRVHPVISARWVDGAYEVTFPCGMCTATMRCPADATPDAVAAEMAQQYRYQEDNDTSNGGK